MGLKELEPIITLITLSEERLSGKVDEVHGDVLATRKQVTLINGRLRQVEIETSSIKVNCNNRRENVDEKLAYLKPTIKVTRFIGFITKNPKFSVFVALFVMAFIQTMILTGMEHEWITQLIELIK